jgi:hypothetical protein
MLLHVVSLELLQDYKVLLGFDNNEKRVFDYRPHIDTGVFKKLKNPIYFARASIQGGTVAWDGDLDFAPEYLYEKGLPV